MTLFQRPDQVEGPLYVVCTVFNPVRFVKRWKLYEDFARHAAAAGAVLYTAEIAYGERDFVLTDRDNPRHLQLCTRHELWLKENALNLLIQRLPIDWQYVAWIDPDISFARGDWANETLHQLQHYDVVQMFSHAIDLTNEYEPIYTHKGFVYAVQNGLIPITKPAYEAGHPGYAWAATRRAVDTVGGLIDTAILGAADRHMAMGLFGEVGRSYPRGMSAGYKASLRKWQTRAAALKQNVGYMPGSILHYWHGPKANRRYRERWEILTKRGYDPDLDLARDAQGLWQLTDRLPTLRDDIRSYFRQRNEDQV